MYQWYKDYWIIYYHAYFYIQSGKQKKGGQEWKSCFWSKKEPLVRKPVLCHQSAGRSKHHWCRSHCRSLHNWHIGVTDGRWSDLQCFTYIQQFIKILVAADIKRLTDVIQISQLLFMKWVVNNVVWWGQTEAMNISLMDGVGDSTRGFPLSVYIGNAFQSSMAYHYQHLYEQNSSKLKPE
jgi:hypothetical protein